MDALPAAPLRARSASGTAFEWLPHALDLIRKVRLKPDISSDANVRLKPDLRTTKTSVTPREIRSRRPVTLLRSRRESMDRITQGSMARRVTESRLAEETPVRNPPSPAMDSLSSDQIQMFLAGLSGLAPEEVRKAKRLYLRNAGSEYCAMRQGLSGFRAAQGCLAMIPIFWPILWAAAPHDHLSGGSVRDRIRNAVDVWRDDLKGERFDLGDEVIVA